MGNLSAIPGLVSVSRHMRKGAWTNDPADPNYLAHWEGKPLQPEEEVTRVWTGSMVPEGTKSTRLGQMVNVRETNRGRFYVDVPKVPAVGPVAKLADWTLSAKGLKRHPVIDRSGGRTRQTPSGQEILRLSMPGQPTVIAHPPPYVGRPSNLSPLGQAKNTWKLLRGRS